MSHLPPILNEIEEVVGTVAMLRLVAARGGTRISIPARIYSNDHWLVQTLGRKTAESLCDHFRILSDGREVGVSDLLLPMGPANSQKQARREVARMLQEGSSVRQAARSVGVHERTAFRILSNIKGCLKTRQLDIFKKG